MTARTWEQVTLHHGDCLAVLRELPDESVHVIITDPPYGLAEHKPERIAAALVAWTSGDRDHVPTGAGGFMGRAWDTFVPPPAVWDECLRVLKPGGHLAAFAGSRTYDLMGMSIRLAGFEIRDGLQWLYGSGMPKGQNVGKAIDKSAGAERSVPRSLSARGEGFDPKGALAGRLRATSWCEGCGRSRGSQPANCQCDTAGAPATPEAARWEGWNTSLRPAHEPIVLARKPIRGTVAANVLAHGTGALNVDACRVEGIRDRTEYGLASATRSQGSTYGTPTASADFDGNKGRWPSNVLLTHAPECHEPGECTPGCVVAELDAQSGIREGGHTPKRRIASMGYHGGSAGTDGGSDHRDDPGGASRYFPSFRYQAKAPGSERPKIDGKGWPTVKPQGLCRWLVRLLTPPGGAILDPFAGTGSTLQAARDEGFTSIGIERDDLAFALSCQRLDTTTPPAAPVVDPPSLFELPDEAAS